MSAAQQALAPVATWLEELVEQCGADETTWAGSLYAFPAADHAAVAAALASSGAWVHVDVIIRPDGSLDGVPPASLSAVRRAAPTAAVEVHVIDLREDRPADGSAGSAAALDAVLAQVLAERPQRLVVPASRWAAADRAAQHLRAAGGQVWVEVPPEGSGTALPGPQDVDGALVMLIEPGSRDEADLQQLALVRALAPTLPVGVDGGVDAAVATACLAAGATHVVSGRALVPSTRTPTASRTDAGSPEEET